MADVQLFVGGQKYVVSCGEGQEENLKNLASMLDEKVGFIKSRMPVSESLGLVMGALLLASDLTEKIRNLPGLRRKTPYRRKFYPKPSN